jgi:hypothetical protein
MRWYAPRPQNIRVLVVDWFKLQGVLQEVIQFRQKKADIFCPNSPGSAGTNEYLPWTAAAGKGGLREALLLQVCHIMCQQTICAEMCLPHVSVDSFL